MNDATRHGAELLAPAGDFETALAAFDAGADAVYCGLAAFSARAFAKNLTADELDALMRVADARGRKVYVTFNTLVEEAELDEAVEALATLDEIGVDGLIVQDLGIAKIVREHFPRLALHASTQLVAHNLEGVLALKELGFVRVVLAREMTLEEIESIVKRCGTEIECFIHGALCYSISGLCLFSAMENGRSGNRGRCAYCCRMAGTSPQSFPFSMRDMRLGEDARRLAAAGVASLKIEGRMKSPLYVASAVKYYREILDGARRTVTDADLETVFSRRTTKLYIDGRRGGEDVLDSSSLGHVGTPIGIVKRVTKDREGRAWLRFHTDRAIERHDGLQIVARDGSKKCGFGIGEMRQAISRAVVFAVDAHSDVEVRLDREEAEAIECGDTVCCSMSNEMKRRFPAPAFRPSDYPGTRRIDVTLSLSPHEMRAQADGEEASVTGDFAPARNADATLAAARKAFEKLGGTPYALSSLALDDPAGLFAPASALNELRRRLVEKLDEAAKDRHREKVAEISRSLSLLRQNAAPSDEPAAPTRTVKLTAAQPVPDGEWNEVIRLLPGDGGDIDAPPETRLATPVFTSEKDFGRLRIQIKRHIRRGFAKWEVADLAALRLLKALGITDITADWTPYATNSAAIATLAALGISRMVASPENSAQNLDALAAAPFPVEFLCEQNTPLFISLNKPGEPPPQYEVRHRGDLWITTRKAKRSFHVPADAPTRCDLSLS